MENRNSFTEGKIVLPLLRFALPVLGALFLQAMYGAVDLLIVGKFASSSDVSAVANGSQIMFSVTSLISSFAMGTTILLGQKIGEKKPEEGGRIVGSSLLFFAVVGVILTLILVLGANALTEIMHAPEKAFGQTVLYTRICGFGIPVIIAYNLIGSVFRGLGDSKTPLLTVFVACICNIAGDLFLVAVVHLGAAGAAGATVGAQLISVLVSLYYIGRKDLPFTVTKSCLRWNAPVIRKILSLGTPIAIQDFLVSISFLVILAIVNTLGVTASAAVGIAEKACMFIMLLPLSFMNAMAAFTAQNRGARKPERAEKGLWSAIGVSLLFAVVLFLATFFRGDLLAAVFSSDAAVTAAAGEYLKAYAIDCLLVCFLFCFVGYFNGMECTRFVMFQGIAGAFGVRVPLSFILSRIRPASLFLIGLATPASSAVQIILCLLYFFWFKKKTRTQLP